MAEFRTWRCDNCQTDRTGSLGEGELATDANRGGRPDGWFIDATHIAPAVILREHKSRWWFCSDACFGAYINRITERKES